VPTSNGSDIDRSVGQLAADLCWGAWAELGVSGWGRTHQQWAIDPEPLIIFTALIGEKERRLQDEAMDWCIHNWRSISQTRLRNLLRLQTDLDAWGPFAATVNARAGVRWPEATTERTSYRVTGRSTLRSLSEPSLVALRMRAMFGVGTRTEILRFLLLDPGSSASAVTLAAATSSAKRNVADECDRLAQAGVLSVRTVGNRFYYSLRHPSSLAHLVGSTPSIAPSWNALFRVVGTITALAGVAGEVSRDVLIVETHQAALAIEDDLGTLGIEGPERVSGAGLLEVWDRWATGAMGKFAAGGWPGAEPEPAVRPRPVVAASRQR
jgi:hypothetical protein